MVKCQNCGNANAPESHYCRFCGSALVARQQNSDYNLQAPRPYSWKTDEYQTQTEARRPKDSPGSAAFPGSGAAQGYSAPPAPYTAPQMFAEAFRCPNCMSQLLPRKERRISTAGWITFAVLLVFFFPLFWIGLLIKEDVHICPSCEARLK